MKATYTSITILFILTISVSSYGQKKFDNLLSVKLIKTHKDTLVDYNFLSKDFVFSSEIELNYPKLTDKTKDDGILIISNDSMKVRLKESMFEPSKHRLTYEDTFNSHKNYELILIDGEKYFGTVGEQPKTEISEITIEKKGVILNLNTKYIKDLFNPKLRAGKVEVYIVNVERLIITMWCSDGGGTYFAAFIIRNGNVEKRIINKGF